MKIFQAILIAILIFPLTSKTVKAEENSNRIIVTPVDEATQDPDFFAFRRNLIKALIDKDHDFIKSIVSDDIKHSFGGDDGLERFYQKWLLEQPDSLFYPTLMDVLLNGGEFAGEGETREFCAPYTFTTDRLSDPLNSVIVMSGNIPIYDKPSVAGNIIDRASYEALKVDWEMIEENWRGVYVPDDKHGYVQTIFVRNPTDYRACFAKEGKTYKMNLFVAGD